MNAHDNPNDPSRVPGDDLDRAADENAFAEMKTRKALRQLELREMEALKLYEPQGWQDACHRSLARERIARKGNRSGGTLMGAVEIARAALGCDPYGKYDTVEPLMIWLVGWGMSHIGRVFYPFLFQPGAFQMIQDDQTGKWRAFRPWTEADKGREAETKKSLPLIPRRAIADRSWHNKGKREFSLVRLKNGTHIYAFSSDSEPAQGVSVDAVWVDEDICKAYWIPELQARGGTVANFKLLWTAYPHNANDALHTMSQRAEDEAGEEHPEIEEFRGTYSGNPHISEEIKRKQLRMWEQQGGPEELQARDQGEFITESVLIFPNFSIHRHGMDPRRLPSGAVPHTWCRYAVIDPGHTVLAVLFAAVPPPGELDSGGTRFGDIVLLYDELYLRSADAFIFGEAMARKCTGQTFRTFIIDLHGGTVTSAGDGRRHDWHYSQQLKVHGVRCESTGSIFMPGCDDIQRRIDHARGWLFTLPDGSTKLQVLKGRLPNFEKEIQRYRKKRLPNGFIDDMPDNKRHNHLMDCFAMLAAHEPQWHAQVPRDPEDDPITKLFRSWEKENDSRQGQQYVNLGVGTGARVPPSYN